MVGKAVADAAAVSVSTLTTAVAAAAAPAAGPAPNSGPRSSYFGGCSRSSYLGGGAGFPYSMAELPDEPAEKKYLLQFGIGDRNLGASLLTKIDGH